MKANLGNKLLTKTFPDGFVFRFNNLIQLIRVRRRVHGFTIRGDATDPHERAIKEEANNDAMAFLAKWLKHSSYSNSQQPMAAGRV